MKKIILLVGSMFCLFTIHAQTIYSQSFTGTSVPSGWATLFSSFTLANNNKLQVTMVDSTGPQQWPLAASPAANWSTFQLTLPQEINMAAGCKCVTFDIDNSGNQDMTMIVQAHDVNYIAYTNNTYTDGTIVAIAAGYVGPVTVNFSGKFENLYGWPVPGGKIDSTHITKFTFLIAGISLPVQPLNKKFKGNFTLDNFTVSGILGGTEINIKKGGISIPKGGTTSLPNVISGLTGTAQTFTIENKSNITLNVSAVSISGANSSEFTLTPPTLPATIAIGSSTTFTVVFSPTSIANGKTVTLNIANDDADEGSYDIIISANGITPPAPEINVKKGSTTILDAGATTISDVVSGSASGPQIFTIENTGTANLNVLSTTLSGTNLSEFILIGPSIPVIAPGTSTTFTIIFIPTSIASGKTVTVTILSDDADEASYTIDITANGVVASTNSAQAAIASSKLYPNPGSDLATLELNLYSVSDVKITLSDIMGKEVMTIAQGSMSVLATDINVSVLNKGIYTVNYFINGAAAKSELLMVK